MQQLLLLTLFAAFVPYSWQTPIGYVSLIDCLVLVSFAASVASVLRTGRVVRFKPRILFLSFFAYAMIVLTQLINSVNADTSILIKYFVFLVVIPLLMAFEGINLRRESLVRRIPVVLAFAGLMLAIIVFIQLLRGAVKSDGASYYVSFFGQAVNKNGMANILMFGTLGSVWCIRQGRAKWYWAITSFLIATTFYIGARAATLVDLIMVSIVALSGKRITLTMVAVAIGCLVMCIFLGFVIIQLGLFSGQIGRLIELSNTNTSDVTASSSRILLWHFAVEKIIKSPWIGNGYGTFSYAGGGWLDGMYEPHNNVLQILYAGGSIGFLSFAVLIILGFKGGRRTSDGRFVVLITIAYLLSTCVDIIWVRGDGHLFWLLFFLVGLTPGSTKALAAKAGGEVGVTSSASLSLAKL